MHKFSKIWLEASSVVTVIVAASMIGALQFALPYLA